MPESQTRNLFEDTLRLLSQKSDEIKTFPVYSSVTFPNRIMKIFNMGLKTLRSQAIIVPQKDAAVLSESINLHHLILKKYAEFDQVRELLHDNKSKTVFDWILKYRLAYAFIGGQALYLFNPPITSEEYKTIRRRAKHLKHGKYYHIDGFQIEAEREVIETNWLLNQYKYEGFCEPEPGDNIFDIGAFTGETSIWFISVIEGKGRVFSFEPEPINFKKLSENIAINNLQESVTPVPYGLWDINQTLRFSNSGGGNTIKPGGAKQLEVVKFDDYIRENNINKIDFIKMDIEGAEMAALRGAASSIKLFKPKLAISIYHRASDIIDIPLFLISIVPEYKFFMKHVTTNFSETILFATI